MSQVKSHPLQRRTACPCSWFFFPLGGIGGRSRELSPGGRFDVRGRDGGVRILENLHRCVSPPSGTTAAWQCFVWYWLVGTLCVDSTDPFSSHVTDTTFYGNCLLT